MPSRYCNAAGVASVVRVFSPSSFLSRNAIHSGANLYAMQVEQAMNTVCRCEIQYNNTQMLLLDKWKYMGGSGRRRLQVYGRKRLPGENKRTNSQTSARRERPDRQSAMRPQRLPVMTEGKDKIPKLIRQGICIVSCLKACCLLYRRIPRSCRWSAA